MKQTRTDRPVSQIVDRFRAAAENRTNLQLEPAHVAVLLSGGFLEWLGKREAAELMARDAPETPKSRHSVCSAYSAAALAERWQVSATTIYNLIQSGRLEAFKFGTLYRIKTDEVDRYEEEGPRTVS